MKKSCSNQFSNSEYGRQVCHGNLAMHPFGAAALPHWRGRELDFVCGIGNLDTAATERGCALLALDVSQKAVDHVRKTATTNKLHTTAATVELRTDELEENFDAIASFRLLMFFDCPSVLRQLAQLQYHLRPRGKRARSRRDATPLRRLGNAPHRAPSLRGGSRRSMALVTLVLRNSGTGIRAA